MSPSPADGVRGLDPAERRARMVPAAVSLAVGLLVFAAKMAAWKLTGSAAVLSDGLESIVNVVAAMFALFALRFAAQPADRDHPYGHGKIEFLAAAFEGGLVAFAATLIFYTGVRTLWLGAEVRRLDEGLAIGAAAAVVNLGLGAWLVRRGRQLASPTLIADGTHVLSDVWTTGGVLVGLLLVKLTGLAWLDPVTALVVGALLARTGVQLVRESADGLLDREDPALLERLVAAFNESHVPGIASVHRLRAIRSGDVIHVDAHVHVPEHWSVREAHDAAQRLEDAVKARSGILGDIALHLDPCRLEPCRTCDLPACPARHTPTEPRRPLTVEEAVGPPPKRPGRDAPMP